MSATTTSGGDLRHDFACDRCDARARFYPDEKITIGLGCDCGGAWIDLEELAPKETA